MIWVYGNHKENEEMSLNLFHCFKFHDFRVWDFYVRADLIGNATKIREFVLLNFYLWTPSGQLQTACNS